ncbi:G coupled receptor like [Fusarium acutatum]|uniref:G coupled receptor like n=1 Tax=Fusarium acutatum TaxID=78861 RepID=A0A8H4JZH1_9HYPO|nr:G coupled receptor like [Fusarium acutatum]
MSSAEHLSNSQLRALSIIERTCSVFSLLGSLFIIATFLSSKAFHKPINRLVFYASFGNMMTNVGTLMSRSYIGSPNSVGCQFQAFLIQMFMPADAFWTLSMAINVYLTFYFKFDARRLRKMEIPYLIGCYGIPFVPAFVYIFIKNEEGHRMYGNATLWCWVSMEWDIWRIITFYGPVWVVIAITFFIYIRAGSTIYRKRQELDDFSSTDRDLTYGAGDHLGTIKTTEVSVTTEVVTPNAIHLQPMGGRRAPDPSDPSSNAYSVHISAQPSSGDVGHEVLPIERQQTRASVQVPAQQQQQRSGGNPARRRNRELSNAAWQYTKCALLFFTAILITWVPSSANRVYSVFHTKNSSVPLEFMSAFVLPLQGFWNALIYMVTSWSACKNLATDLRMGRRPDVTELVGGMAPEVGANNARTMTSHHRHNLGQFRRSNKFETESMTELANESRPTSDDERRDNVRV